MGGGRGWEAKRPLRFEPGAQCSSNERRCKRAAADKRPFKTDGWIERGQSWWVVGGWREFVNEFPVPTSLKQDKRWPPGSRNWQQGVAPPAAHPQRAILPPAAPYLDRPPPGGDGAKG